MLLRPVLNIDPHAAHLSQAETISGLWNFTVHPTGLDHGQLANIGTNTHVQIDAHITNNTNPHGISLTQSNLTVTESFTAGGAALSDAVDIPLVIDNLGGTQNIFEVKDNGSAVLSIADGGNIGIFALPVSSAMMRVDKSLSYTSGNYQAMNFRLTQDIATSGEIVGALGQAQSSHASGNITGLVGLKGYLNHLGAGALVAGHAVYGDFVIGAGAGSVTSAFGGRFMIRNADAAINKAYGVYGYIDAENGSITNAYAIYAEEPQVALGSIARSWAGYFNGDVQISSGKKLILEGSANQKGDSYFVFQNNRIEVFINGVLEGYIDTFGFVSV